MEPLRELLQNFLPQIDREFRERFLSINFDISGHV
ncbi:hypothetical protein GGE67_006228 [Rhizobium leucaenae]|nr:hypothetical protein [Rhizobium leucaenae]